MSQSAVELGSWLKTQAEMLAGRAVELQEPIDSLGIDSLEAQNLLEAFEHWSGTKLDSRLLRGSNSLADIVAQVIEQPAQPELEQAHGFESAVNPYLARLLRALALNKRFVKGSGSRLSDENGREYLDCLSGYGAVPFGHNPPFIWEHLEQVRKDGLPGVVQPSLLDSAGQLAQGLLALLPRHFGFVTFGNSGAEAVEAAIKLARMSSGRQRIIAARNSFHGKTLGALSATGNPSYQTNSGAPAPHFEFVTYGNIEELERALAASPPVAALILEPVQGEGGAVVPPPGYLKQAEQACRRVGALLIIDEVQTGFCRTGPLFAFAQDGLEPDILVLAKALGAGMLPIGACVASKRVFCESFALKHSSTFGGSTLACEVGCRVVREFSERGVAIEQHVAAVSNQLVGALERLVSRYPEVLREVRGRGLLLGLRLRTTGFPERSLLRVLAEQELLSALFSSHLLNVSGVRVAPTLNGSDVVRIEPPLNFALQDCEQVIAAVDSACQAIRAGAGACFADIFRGEKQRVRVEAVADLTPAVQPSFAFLAHPLQAGDYALFDRSLRRLSDRELDRLSNEGAIALDPFAAAGINIEVAGRRIEGDIIIVPRTAEQLVAAPWNEALAVIQSAAELAVSRGAKLIGLGAYTSVIARAGADVQVPGVRLTSGNAFTVIVGARAADRALAAQGRSWSSACAAVVGAAGSVGGGLCLLTALRAPRLVLIGNPRRSEAQNLERLRAVLRKAWHTLHETQGQLHFEPGSVAELMLHTDHAETALHELEASRTVRMTRDVAQGLPGADVIFTATSAPSGLIRATHLKRNAIVCELSRPFNVAPSVLQMRPDVRHIEGGLATVPAPLSLDWLGLPTGEVYGCLGETLLLALTPELTPPQDPELDLPYLLALDARSRELGFELGKSEPTRSVALTPNVAVARTGS